MTGFFSFTSIFTPVMYLEFVALYINRIFFLLQYVHKDSNGEDVEVDKYTVSSFARQEEDKLWEKGLC
jgi:hypothetical protein